MHRVLIEHPHISSYSFCLLLGFFAGFLLARWNARKAGLEGRHVDNVTLLLVVAGLMGARVFSWLFYFPPGIGFWKGLFLPGGGLVFYGGVIFGVATVGIYAALMRVSLRKLADVLAGPLALGLAFGRIGCFAAGCCWGDLCVSGDVTANLTAPEKARIQTFAFVSSEGFGVRFPPETGAFKQHHRLGLIRHHASSSLPVHPVQLYEALLAFALVAWLQWRRSKPHAPGGLFCAFGVGYGVIRFALEFLRADNSPAYLGLTLSQVISVITVGVFLPLLLYGARGARAIRHGVPEAAGQLAPR